MSQRPAARPGPLTLARSCLTSGCLGLISSVRWPFMMVARCASPPSACAFMMRSMVALHPYLPLTTTQGPDARRRDTLT